MARVTVQDALEYCLANPDGLGVGELLKRFPEYQGELQPLLALSSRIEAVAPPPVPAERRAAIKARLMEAAAAGQQATQVAQVQPPRQAVIQQERKPRWIWSALRRPLFAAGAMAVLVVGLLWWGAASSLPDSPFYNIKIASENFMLNFAGGAEEKARAHLALANSRLVDIEEMERQGKLAAAGSAIENYNDHMNDSVTLWKQTSDGAKEDIKKGISESVTNGEKTFKDLGTDLPDPVKGDVERVVSNLLAIRDELAKDAPGPTPGSGTPTVSATPSKTAVPSVVGSPPPSVVVTSTMILSIDVRIPPTSTETPIAGQSPTVSGVDTPRPGATSPPVGGTSIASATSTSRARSTATPKPVITSLPTNTRQPTRTLAPKNTSTPTRTRTPSTPSRTPGVGATSTPFRTATRTYTATYTATSTATSRAASTSTATTQIEASPTRGRPTTATPTNTPHPPDPPKGTPVATIGAPPARTATPTRVPTQTSTRVPPTNTRVPTPTSTHVPTAVTAEPTASTSCELDIDELEVESSCQIGGHVEWGAEVENEASAAQQADWEAVLKIKFVDGGPYIQVERITGSATFQPHHTTEIGGSFSYVILPDTKTIRVELTLTRNGEQCDEKKVKEKDCDG